MPELVSNQPHDRGGRLKFKLDLITAENPEAWEGWLIYEIGLMNGDDVMVSNTQRTMMDDEVIRLCEVLEGSAQGEFEPMEPDFYLVFRSLKIDDTSKEYEGLIFMNEAIRRGEGYYSDDGIGLRIPLDESAGRNFARELRDQHAELTKGLRRKR